MSVSLIVLYFKRIITTTLFLHLHDQALCNLHFLTTYFLLDLSESIFHPHLSTELSLSKVTNDMFLSDVTTPIDSVKPATPLRLLSLPLPSQSSFTWFSSSLLLCVSLLVSSGIHIPISYPLLTTTHPHGMGQEPLVMNKGPSK